MTSLTSPSPVEVADMSELVFAEMRRQHTHESLGVFWNWMHDLYPSVEFAEVSVLWDVHLPKRGLR